MKSSGKTLFLLALFFSLGLGVYFSTQVNTTKLNTRSLAAGGSCSGDPDSDNNGCINGGNLTNGCNWICNNEAPPGTVLHVPPCCDVVKNTGDPHACCFDALRRCTADQCAAIPDDQRQTCGDPPGPCRCGQLWALGGYCNPPAQPTNTPRPTSPVVPSNTPRPTKRPKATAVPTQPPQATQAPQPTQNPQNTVSPTSSFFPTNAPQPTTITIYNNDATFMGNNFNPELSNQPYPEQQIFPVLSLPNIPIPHLDIVGPAAQTITTVDAQLPRTLDFFEYAFSVVQIADRKLELFINGSFSRLLRH